MQQAALLKAMVAHIFMSNVFDGVAREQGIAMLAMRGKGIGAIDCVIARWR
jgi:hypothetical protein